MRKTAKQGDRVGPLRRGDLYRVLLEGAPIVIYASALDVQDHVPARLLRRFFVKGDRGYTIVKRVRDLCVFAKQDLIKDPPFANVDLISCCNVLIYLGSAAQQAILPKFHYALRASGALLLSGAEGANESGDLFAPAAKNCHLYFKKPALSRTRFALGSSPASSLPNPAAARGKPSAERAWPEADIQRVAQRLLLERYAPAAVVIDGDLNVLHFQGHVGRYLEPATGKASLSLMKMLPARAADAVTALIRKAKKSDAPARARDVGLGRSAVVEALPFRLPISGERYFIVVFEEDGASGRAQAKSPPQKAEPVSLKKLRMELESARGYLQSVTEDNEAAQEELKSANEEITSANEELQSTNEELEIAKEELQASNEELSTVNEELQNRNDDLGRLNDDLLNLISSVHLPIVMVSSDLRIRRFSPAAERVMNLIPGDIGRPIGDLKPRIALPNIEEILHGVIESVAAKELEVRDPEGRSYSVRIRPYKTAENKIEGAVLVFMDNDPIKRGLPELDAGSAFEALMDIGSPAAVLDGRMRVKVCARSMYQAFGLTADALGQSLFELSAGLWNVPALRERLERLAARGESFDDLALRVGGRSMSFSARRVSAGAASPR